MNSLETYLTAALEAYLVEGLQETEMFDLAKLRLMTELPQIRWYVERTLDGCCYVGSGQARNVYRLPGGRVIKVAKNQGGLGQNEAEAGVCKSEATADIFPRVFEVGPQAAWLLAEEAQPMTRTKFSEFTGIPWGEFMFAIGGAFPHAVSMSHQSEGQQRQFQQAFDKHYANGFFRRVVNLIKDCKYEAGDIAKLDSWGIVNGRPVIIDSGFTEAVNKTHYQR